MEHAAGAGIWVDQMDNVWFLNRGVAALPIELVAEGRSVGTVLRARA